MAEMVELILGVALKMKDGGIVALAAPNRHHDVIRHMSAAGYGRDVIGPSTQGFWTNKRPFIGRKAAARVAVKAQQLIQHQTPLNPIMLFSEDVW